MQIEGLPTIVGTIGAVSKLTRLRLYSLYFYGVSGLGLLLVVWSLVEVSSYQPLELFLVILLLAVVAEASTTSVRVSEQGSITFEVGTAVSMATIPTFGATAAVLVAAASSLSVWLIQSRHRPDWKQRWRQLAFNVGMHSIAIFAAAQLFLYLQSIGDFWAITALAWLLAAVFYDQANFWLLAIILSLQHGSSFNPLGLWRENRWAMPINILLLSVGSAMLAFAVERFGILGIVIFFLPVILSTYAFQLYVRQMEAHMRRLEEIVAERTQDLAEANRELEELNREKDAFLAVLTHDMRSPLTSIRGFSELIQKHDLPRDKQLKAAQVILQSQETLLEIVENILEIERLQSGVPISLDSSHFDLTLLLIRVAETLEPLAREKRLQLIYEALPASLVLTADEQKIERVIMNLVTNAIKYTPEGGCVSISARADGKWATVEVSDTGLGVPAEELPFIFERYRRVKRHQHHAVGTGLGLAIVKSLIDAHGGVIEVTSEEDKGSTFTIRLPLEPVNSKQ